MNLNTEVNIFCAKTPEFSEMKFVTRNKKQTVKTICL